MLFQSNTHWHCTEINLNRVWAWCCQGPQPSLLFSVLPPLMANPETAKESPCAISCCQGLDSQRGPAGVWLHCGTCQGRKWLCNSQCIPHTMKPPPDISELLKYSSSTHNTRNIQQKLARGKKKRSCINRKEYKSEKSETPLNLNIDFNF